MSKPTTITSELLRSVVRYEPETGAFYWLVDRGPKHVGDRAGTITQQGYRQLTINTIAARANRMAHLYMTGSHPVGQMDHINGDRQDDRWENLRDVTPSMNMQNRKAAQATNKSGLLGVFFLRRKNKWTARLRRRGVDHYIGHFDTPEQAHAAYLAKKRKVHEGCTI